MHEAAVAKEIYDIAARTMEENDMSRLTKVVLDIGEYSAVVPRQLDIVWEIAVHNTPMEGCVLETHELPKTLGMFVRTIEGI